MKKILKNFTLLMISWLAVSFTLSAQAEQMKEIKQPYHGLTLNANLVLADGKSFKDDIVLLTHGTLTHKERSTYQQLQKNLAALGISSLAINLSLGLNDRHGEYDCQVTHTHKHTDALKEIDFWLNWLKNQGAQKVILMGHSRGGNQTAWYAVTHHNPIIKGVVLLALATGEQQSAQVYEHKYGVPLSTVLNKAKKLVAEGKGKQVMKNTDFIYCKKAAVTAESFVNYYEPRPEFDTPTLLKQINKPTLVIMGTDDQVVPDLPKKMQAVHNKMVKTLMIEDADHAFLDFASEDIAQAIADFIQQLEKNPAH